MIILFLLQLLIGTIILFGFFGNLLNVGQKISKPQNYPLLNIVAAILTIGLYCLIAYYFSKSVDLYTAEHKGKTFTAIVTFLLLTFLLNGPAKYAETKRQSEQILLAGTIGLIFYILIRFLPEIGDKIFGWMPIFIWT